MTRNLLLGLLLLLWPPCTSSTSEVFSKSSDFEITIPRKVDVFGTVVSDFVEHHHFQSHRTKRDSAAEQDSVYFEVPYKDSAITLQLQPSVIFISPNLTVNRSGQASRRSPAAFLTCHFQGAVKGEPKSSVAISACNGLVGMLSSEKHGTLWIEPAVKNNSGQINRAHFLYRKSVKNINSPSCGTEDPNRSIHESFEATSRRWKRSGGGGHLHKHLPQFLKESGVLDEKGISEGREHHIEVMVVADRSMIEFHEKESATDLETYLLTVMNLVSAFYRIPSLGFRINIEVVKLKIMDEQDGPAFNVTTNADKTLDSFCLWQRRVNNPDEEHADHHDVAILMTRVDICSKSDKPCGTLGVAHVGGMCDPGRACSVNQDNGLSVAHTVAHELGHNFGMVHDDGDESENFEDCVSTNGSSLHIMAPNFDVNTTSMEWSPCSRNIISRFFTGGLGDCLKDVPIDFQSGTVLPSLPAGALYDAEQQCRLQYGSTATSVCSEDTDFCSYLWCTVNGTCTTAMRPPADGTNCGHRKWCMGRKCVDVRDNTKVVHGGWSEWSAFSKCSRSCGGGVATSERKCDHPRPAHGGLHCSGQRVKHRICNIKVCPKEKQSFKAKQCASFGNPSLESYFGNTSPCASACINGTLYEPNSTKNDGRPSCNPDLCVEINCKRVGCNWRIDSDAEDTCGVCNGISSECAKDTNHNQLQKKDRHRGIIKIVDIPAGAQNIRVDDNSRTFIAIGTSQKHLYVDGSRLGKGENLDMAVAGTVGTYERWGHRESLLVKGPIKELLHVFVIFPGKSRNFEVKFEFTLKKQLSQRALDFYWNFPDWSACSVTCGNGMQIARPHCFERSLGQVENVKCLTKGLPPSPQTRACNLPSCPAKWWSGPWQLCPRTCGPASTKRHRTVLCVKSLEEGSDIHALSDDNCNLSTRPPETEICPGLPECEKSLEIESVTKSVDTSTKPVRIRKMADAKHRGQMAKEDHLFRWHAGEWTQCSKKCGEGSRRRVVICTWGSSEHRVASKHCAGLHKPAHLEPCNNKRPCFE